jgi:23S rRNA pseudouridine955/2504/2580 synthase
LRLPPVRVAARAQARTASARAAPAAPRLAQRILHEDDALLAINKPPGMAVHGGSGVAVGVIEQLRRERPQARALELVHRLDRDTSGVLLIAKKRSALTDVHAQLRAGSVQKHYLALVKGRWRSEKQNVKLPLHKYVLGSGERRVRVEENGGQAAHTIFRLKRTWRDFSLLEAELKTGRTHQIRVHLAHLGYPIAGDDKYGDFELNKSVARQGLKRMFLHACKMRIVHPLTGRPVTIEAPLAEDLVAFLEWLEVGDAQAV